MVVVKLMGGLGNQMFQYAYALNLAKEYGEEILFDTSFYAGDKKIGLYNFNISDHKNWVEIIDYKERKNVVKAQNRYRVLQKMKRILAQTEKLGGKWFYRNIRQGYYFNFDPYFYPFVKVKQDNKYIYGYFQCEKYFVDCRDLVIKAFNLSVPLGKKIKHLQEKIESTNSVAVHVRLGDYKNMRNYYLDVCTSEYYNMAIDYILTNVDSPAFYVFTNDVDKVRDIIDLPPKAIVVEGTKDYEDFELIRSCKHVILSNSSFSWWAAYLNTNEGKKIVAPTPWFRTLKSESDIYLPGMIKIRTFR